MRSTCTTQRWWIIKPTTTRTPAAQTKAKITAVISRVTGRRPQTTWLGDALVHRVTCVRNDNAHTPPSASQPNRGIDTDPATNSKPNAYTHAEHTTHSSQRPPFFNKITFWWLFIQSVPLSLKGYMRKDVQHSKYSIDICTDCVLSKVACCFSRPHMPIGKVWIYRPLFVCLFLFVWLQISPARIKQRQILHGVSSASWAGNLPIWGTLLPRSPKLDESATTEKYCLYDTIR